MFQICVLVRDSQYISRSATDSSVRPRVYMRILFCVYVVHSMFFYDVPLCVRDVLPPLWNFTQWIEYGKAHVYIPFFVYVQCHVLEGMHDTIIMVEIYQRVVS